VRRVHSGPSADARGMSSTTRSGSVAAIAIAAILAVLVLLPSAASARTLQFGAWTPGDPYNGTLDGASALEAATGRHVDIVNWYQSWGGGDWVSAVQQHALAAVSGTSRTPMLTWEPWAPGGGAEQPAYRLSRIAAGEYDLYITTWALAMKLHGGPVYLRPMHEFNGDWYPWSGAANGNTPADFVAAWKRIVDTFRRVGASNVRFVWSPNNIDVPASNDMERYYPGASYVDVLAVDGYNWGTGTPEWGGWQSFSEVFDAAYDRLRALGPQPIWFAEVGSAGDGDKAAWVRDMFARAAQMDRLEALVWFNENKERDWRAAPTPEIAAAFAPGATPAATATATTAKPRLALTITRRPRAGRTAVVRWRASNATSVVRWHAYLNGRRVKTTSPKAAPVARKHIARPGRYRWRVIGRDSRGRMVVSALRSFRVSR